MLIMTIIAVVVIRFEPLVLSVLSLSGGSSLVAGVGCLSRIPEAIETVREEHRRTSDERDAFEDFAEKIHTLNATNDWKQRPAAVSCGLSIKKQFSPGDTTDTVRSLYRETVMNTDHFSEDYDETLPENVATELGPDFASAMQRNDKLHRSLQRALVRASRRAADARAEFQSLLVSELDSIRDAERQLRNVVDTFEQIQNAKLDHKSHRQLEVTIRRLERAEGECTSLIRSRQTEYTEAPVEDGVNLQEYLYGHHEWTFPVVADALDTIQKNVRWNRVWCK
jgi:hypothetical protein